MLFEHYMDIFCKFSKVKAYLQTKDTEKDGKGAAPLLWMVDSLPNGKQLLSVSLIFCIIITLYFTYYVIYIINI